MARLSHYIPFGKFSACCGFARSSCERYKNKECVVDVDVERSPEEGFKTAAEREEYEAYLRAISLLPINAYESKEIPCKIEIIDMDEDAEFYLEYYDDKFKLHRIAINIIVRKKK